MLIIEAKLKKTSDGYICEPQTLKDYQILLEQIMYLMVKTCLDLAYSVFQLAEFNSNPINKY